MGLPEHITSQSYRVLASSRDLCSFHLRLEQSDLLVSCDRDLRELAFRSLRAHRRGLEIYIAHNPFFARSLTPLPQDPQAPPMVQAMLAAAATAGVGPMGAVAGAVAQFVGDDLLPHCHELIIENGGDLFVSSRQRRELAVLAEESHLGCLTFALEPNGAPRGVCTSSGVLGHSLSFGKADAVTVIAASAALADAAATAICNTVQSAEDIEAALALGRRLGAQGVIVLTREHLGAWGCPELMC